jgi:nucleoside diphosphate kinase
VLEKEFKYFIDNQTELFKQFPYQYLAIKDQKVVGVYDNKIDAYLEEQEKHPVDSFLIQFCTPGPVVYTPNFTGYSKIA